MEGETILIFDNGVKCQGRQDNDYDNESRNSFDFGLKGKRSNSQDQDKSLWL